jgi:hypothetical protein
MILKSMRQLSGSAVVHRFVVNRLRTAVQVEVVDNSTLFTFINVYILIFSLTSDCNRHIVRHRLDDSHEPC